MKGKPKQKAAPSGGQSAKGQRKRNISKFFKELPMNVFKSIVSSTLAKLVIYVLSIGGFFAALWNNFVHNPLDTRMVEGYVVDFYNPAMPIPDAKVFVVDNDAVFVTDSKGHYRGTVKVRKKSGPIMLSCGEHPYKNQIKPKDIPEDENETIETNFNLEHLWGEPFASPASRLKSN